MEDKTKKIIDALQSHGDSGCGIITLSLETGISQESLRCFFREYKEFCVPINGKSKFKLNKRAVKDDSTDEILVSIEDRKVKKRVDRAFTRGFFLGLSLLLIDRLIVLFFEYGI